jgi:hypothetical protein
VLLPCDDFWYASETRVAVRDGRVLATTEYYTDLAGGYANVPQLAKPEAIIAYFTQIIAFVRSEVAAGRVSQSAAVDVALLKSKETDEHTSPSPSSFDITLIECNAYDDSFDAGLFRDRDEIEQQHASTDNMVVCRWRDEHGRQVEHVLPL